MKNTNHLQRTFITPEGIISVKKINIDVKSYTFTAEVGVKIKGKKIVTHDVSGKISKELREWLVLKDKYVTIPVADTSAENGVRHQRTGELTTGFRKYLERVNLKFQPGILSTLKFECQNRSDDYYENPFRIVITKDHTIMTLVSKPSKKRQVFEDPATGIETVRYTTKVGTINKDGKAIKVKAFVARKEYRRFVYEEVKQQQPVEA